MSLQWDFNNPKEGRGDRENEKLSEPSIIAVGICLVLVVLAWLAVLVLAATKMIN